MARKPKVSSYAFTPYDNFLYLLAELELVVGAGKIEWSSTSVSAARQRLEILAAKMAQLANCYGSE
jgi:hypothetical protein